MRKFDTVVVGGGLIGLAIALELQQLGIHTAVFEARKPGQEASWASAGILSPAPESPAMIAMVPLGKASLAMYAEYITKLEEFSGMPTGFRANGTLQALFSQHAQEELNTIVALHHGLGLTAEAISASEAREMEPALSEELEAAVLRPSEASVDNRLLTSALLAAAEKSGVEIFSDSKVTAIDRKGECCVGIVIERGDRIQSANTIIAAGCFSSQISGVQQYAPVLPAKGQMVSLRCESAPMERVLWSERIYLVPRNDGRILAGATVEHAGFNKTVTASGMHANLDGAFELAPVLAKASIESTWAGLRPDTPDHMPILGPTDVEGLTIATGHYRSGVLLAPLTAKLVGELITGRTVSVDWDRFSPLRFAGGR